MKTIKILLLFLVLASLFTSCAEPKDFKDKKGKEFTAQPFGWGNESAQKNDTVIYQVSVGDIALSIVFSETIIVPVILTGWYLYEPVRLRDINESKQETDYLKIIIICLIIFGLFWMWRMR